MTEVWITRTQPGADATADRVRALGFTPVIAPLLRVERTDAPASSGEDIAFTSANGPRHYNGSVAGTAWCVGEATADAARAAGFTDIRVGGGDVASLAAMMATELRRPVLHWAGAHVRGDLSGVLSEAGHDARRVVAYRAVAVESPPLDRPVDIVLFHSPRAAEVFASLDRPAVRATVSISPATDSVLAAAKLATLSPHRRYIATGPNDAAMMTALQRAAGELVSRN